MRKIILRKTDYHIEELVKVQLEIQKVFRDRKFDSLFIVSGRVGSGKSTLTQQLANYSTPLSPNIDDTFAFNLKQFKKLLDTKYQQNIILDESIYLMSANHMKAENKDIKIKLTQCRSRRLSIWMCIPDFFSLDRSIVERACGLVYVDLVKPDTEKIRGFYRYYPEEFVLKMYDRYKKSGFKGYMRYPGTIRGHFSNYWVIPEEEYEEAKRKHTSSDEVQGIWCKKCGGKDVTYQKKGLKCKRCGYIDAEYDPQVI